MVARGVAAAALVALAAGCGPEPKDNASTPTQVSPPPSQPASTSTAPAGGEMLKRDELDAVTKAGRPYKIVLIVKTRNNPFFDPMIKAAEAEAKALGAEIKTEAPPQETDKEQQFSIVQTVAAGKPDAILIAPADSKGIVPALKQAADKGTVIVNLDNRVDKPTASSAGLALGAYVGADNEGGGRLAGQAMKDVLSGGGKVALLEGIRGADNAEARKRGFVKGYGSDPVASDSAEWDTQKAYAKFQSMLAAHPEINGLFCANDKMALGAIKAIAEAGKKGKVTVVGYDNISEIKPYLESGEMYATIEQHPDLMGKYGIRAAVGILNGSVTKGKEFLVPLEVIKKGSK